MMIVEQNLAVPRVPPLLDLQYAQTRQATTQGRPATGGRDEDDDGGRGWRRRVKERERRVKGEDESRSTVVKR
jgi:hypothetical protein